MITSRRDVLAMGLCSAALFALPGADAFGQPSKLTLPDATWRKRLSPAAYVVLRQGGTEPPFSSPLDKEHRQGLFLCGGCGQAAFSSATKFDSGTGWPSFWRPIAGAVSVRSDHELAEERTEVHCSRCSSHLGHVFDDGPPPTGKRYCMNGVAMTFRSGGSR